MASMVGIRLPMLLEGRKSSRSFLLDLLLNSQVCANSVAIKPSKLKKNVLIALYKEGS